MRENFNKDFEWQKGYGVFSVDKISISRLKNYITRQEEHHKDKMTFQQELNLLIKRYNLD
jgi:putative transposase